MKFEINNSKLKQVIFKFLDDKNLISNSHNTISNLIYFIESEESEYATIKIIKGNKETYCRVDDDLVSEVSSFFSISDKDSFSYIIDWVENKLGINITQSYGVGSLSRPNYMTYRRM